MLRVDSVSKGLNWESKHEILHQGEKVFLSFISEIVNQALFNYNLIYIGVNKPMKRCFNNYVLRSINHKYNKADYNLDEIVTSLWIKAKLQVETELKSSNDEKGILNEEQCQASAYKKMKALDNENKRGKVFTYRQARCLLAMNASTISS